MTEEKTTPKRSRPGRQALFTNASAEPAAPATVGEGRRALFSEAPASAEPPRPDRTSAVIHCRTCRAATKVSIASLGFSLLPSLWMPTRPYPRLIRCPACHHRSWCRIEWPKLL